MDFSKLLDGFVKIDTRISLCFSWICKIDRWISLSCYMDLSKLKQGFVKVATWTDQTCFCPFPKKAEF